MASKRRHPVRTEDVVEREADATPKRRERTRAAAAAAAAAEAEVEAARPDKRRRVAVADTKRAAAAVEAAAVEAGSKRPACREAGAAETEEETKKEEKAKETKKQEKTKETKKQKKESPVSGAARAPVRLKRRRAVSPPPPASRVVSPPPVKLRRTASGASAEGEAEEKVRVPSRTRVPSFGDDGDIPKENREEEAPAACRSLQRELRREDERAGPRGVEEAKHQALLRSLQVTPPPSARMLDKKNPPPPPPRPKRRWAHHRAQGRAFGGGIAFDRPFPRLALSPLMDSPPTSQSAPGSPQRVFRSLANDFIAVQDTPQTHRVRPAPQMARASRRSTRSGGRRSIDTPTSTMVLRSRQLNHNTQPSLSKPENAREREQREFHEREGRNA